MSKKEYMPQFPKVCEGLIVICRALVEASDAAQAIAQNDQLELFCRGIYSLHDDGVLPPLFTDRLHKDVFFVVRGLRDKIDFDKPTREQKGMMMQLDALARKFGGNGFIWNRQ